METKVISAGIDGVWDFENIIGAPCWIISERMAHRQFVFSDYLDKQQTIEKVRFRVLTDGKIIPLFKLKGIDNQYFTADNLFIHGIVKYGSD